MNKVFIAVAICLLVAAGSSAGVSPCPIQSNIGSLISGTCLLTQLASPSPNNSVSSRSSQALTRSAITTPCPTTLPQCQKSQFVLFI